MNIKKLIAVFAIFAAIIVINVHSVHAADNSYEDVEMNTDFDVKDYEERDELLSVIEIKLITTDYKGMDVRDISCFDVNENGDIAVVYDIIPSTKTYICIYNSYGEFQYGYTYLNYGMVGVEWDGKNVITYSVRGDRLILLDRYANVLDIKEVINNTEASERSHKAIFVDEKEINGDIYKKKSGKLIKTDKNGNQQVIIDRSKNYNIHKYSMMAYMIILTVIALIWLIRLFIKKIRW